MMKKTFWSAVVTLSFVVGVAGCASSQPVVSRASNSLSAEDALAVGGREDSLLLARSLFLLALELENREVPVGVDRLYLRAFGYDPTDRWLGFRALETQLAVGNMEEAQRLLPLVASLSGDTTVSQYLLLAQLWRHAEKLDSALVALNRGEELDDENIRLLFEKVLVLEGLGDFKEMSRVHTRLVRLLDYPSELVWKQVYLNTMLKDLASQEVFYRELWVAQGDAWGLELLRLLVESKRYRDGTEVAQKLLERSPRDEDLQNILINLLQKQGRDSSAIDQLLAFYEADTSRIGLLYLAGRMELKEGRTLDGIKHLNEVIVANPRSSWAHFFLSMGYAQVGETERALSAANAALALDSANATLHTHKVLLLLAGLRHEEAMTALSRWKQIGTDTSAVAELRATIWVSHAFYLEEQPGGRSAADSLRRLALPQLRTLAEGSEVRVLKLVDLATTLERLGRFEEAKVHFERVLANDPDNASALNYYGYSLLVRGEQLQRADSLVTRALILDPGNDAFLDSKAWSLHLQGRHAEALEILDEMERRGKLNQGELLEHKALVLEALGRMSEALNYWKRVVDLYPAHAETLKSLPEELKNSTNPSSVLPESSSSSAETKTK